MDEDATWYGDRPRPRPYCVGRTGTGFSPRKGHSSPPIFGPRLLWPRPSISATVELLFVAVIASLPYCTVLTIIVVQNSQEVFVCMSSIVVKMFVIFSLYLDHRISVFLVHRVGSPLLRMN